MREGWLAIRSSLSVSSRAKDGTATGAAGRAIVLVSKPGNMPTSITLNDRLAERIAVLAAEAGQPVDAFVERVLQGLVDADIEIRDGIPVFRMPPDAPTLTSADVDRFLHSDLDQ